MIRHNPLWALHVCKFFLQQLVLLFEAGEVRGKRFTGTHFVGDVALRFFDPALNLFANFITFQPKMPLNNFGKRFGRVLKVMLSNLVLTMNTNKNRPQVYIHYSPLVFQSSPIAHTFA